MVPNDYCRLCKLNMREDGPSTYGHSTDMFLTKKATSISDRLALLGLIVAPEPEESNRCCSRCSSIISRLEKDLPIFRQWEEEFRDSNVSKRQREPTPAKTPTSLKKTCPNPPSPSASSIGQTTTQVTITYPSQTLTRVCDPEDDPIIKFIVLKRWNEAASHALKHQHLQEKLKDGVINLIRKECEVLCSRKNDFILWKSKPADLKSFSFKSLRDDLHRLAPFLLSIFNCISNDNNLAASTAAAIAIRGRQPRLAALSYWINSILQYGGAKKSVFNRLSQLSLTTSHKRAVKKQHESAQYKGGLKATNKEATQSLEDLHLSEMLPLSSLRLLVSPLQLMSAALWGVVDHRAVMHYGLLEDFITAVLDIIPELLTRSERNQLVLGLRAQVVLDMCRSDDLCSRQNIEPHLTRIDDLIKEQDEEEVSSSKLKASVDYFSKVVYTLLDDPYERDMFYQKTFPSVFGLNFDSALCALVRTFLMNLEKLLPVPSLDQTSLWLGLSSPVLTECGAMLNQPEALSELIQHHKQDYDLSPGPFVNDFIFSSLSGQQNNDKETESRMSYLNGSCKEEADDLLVAEVTEDDVPSVEVTLDESDTDPQDYDSSVTNVNQTPSGSSKTYRCFVCGQTFSSLFELKRHIIPRCSADAAERNKIGWKKNERFSMDYAASNDSVQMNERSSRKKTCSVCGDTFTFSKDLINHMRAHIENGSHICDDCGKDFDNYENYTLHQENGCKTSRRHSMDVDYSQDMDVGHKGIKECKVILRRISDDAAISPQICTVSCQDCGQRVLKRGLKIHRRKCFQKNCIKESPINANCLDLTCIKPCKLISSTRINKSNIETHSEPQLNRSSAAPQSISSSKNSLLKCTLCDGTFSKFILMKRHYTSFHKIKGSYQCPVCKRSFVRLCELVKHHRNKLLYLCNTCERCFPTPFKLRQHKKQFNDNCATLFICEICGKSCISASFLKYHKYMHNRPKESTVCSYCGKNFSSKHCLQVHMNRHTGGFSCPICPKVFYQKTYLKRHMNKHNGVLHPYLCEICGKDFPTKGYLKSHMFEHSKERPFKCDQCGKTFKKMYCLNTHISTKHTEQKQFLCSVCGAGFRYSSLLKEHTMNHTGVRPHVCSKCGKGFRRRHHLKVHLTQKTKCGKKKL